MTTLPNEIATGALPVPEPLIFPCSSSQRRCWFIDALHPGSTILNIALRWELEGEFSPPVIERALQFLINRHEILRTRFYVRDGEPVQEVLPQLRFKLSQVDLTMVPEATRADEAVALAKREAKAPFQLDRPPLIRVTLIRTGSNRVSLLVTVHQIAFDGISIGLLAHEFGLVTAALQAGSVPTLPELPMQYGDYASWQKAMFSSRGFEAEAAYWRRQLAGAPYFEVAPDLPRPAVPASNGHIIAQMLPQEFSDALDAFAKTERVTLFGLCYAAAMAGLHRVTGETDLVIGTQLASRHHPDLEKIVGVFLNNLVLRVAASGDLSLRDFLQRANRTVQDALIHQQMPFDHLVELLNPPRDPSRTPLISINFAVLHEVIREETYGTFDLRAQPSLSPGSLYELNFFLVHWPSGWRLALEFNTDLFELETAEHLLAGWRAALDGFLLDADRPLSALPIALRTAANSEECTAVEEVLLLDPLVAEAAVVAHSRPDGTPAPYAYVVPAADVRQPLETLPVTLMGHLARDARLQTQPAGISVLLALPRTAGGAIDRPALPHPPAAVTGPPAKAGPPSEIEAAIRTIWQDVLDVTAIDPDSNFFDLGGHSLLAVRMCVQVGRRLGRQVDVVSLFRSPTLAAFVRHVESLKEDATDGQIVVVQPDGDGTPIIAINHLLSYYDLSRAVGSGHPFYSVQTLDAHVTPAVDGRSFEEIAADYVRLIRKIRPQGPYILFGLCVHGLIGYEVAQQLRAAGDEVEVLAFVNGWHPNYFERLSLLNKSKIRLKHVKESLALVFSGKKTFAEFLSNYSLAHKVGILKAAVALKLIDRVPPRTGSETADGWLLYLMNARNLYRPKPYPGRVVQFLGMDAPRGRGFDPILGWTGTLTGSVLVQDVEGGFQGTFADEALDTLIRQLHLGLSEISGTERAVR
ncbi:hypothetical protein ASF49_14345 [Methylobacterium sp. Leaf104]|uniref:condensation domain-containing protein n=1 Tax=Methylobacterium TaxID=407 RepID=UPI0006FA5DBC|nr:MULTISPECIES: condensation domain-containing protein [Methylobacterium]KQP29860.1 hypothetical protein ASF49_14345 [Methylobacterium sp. Leaf104]MCI9882451.1 hypothetical protein [Methylobacterium goesingense]